jgi:hypothetical protein
MKHKFVAHPQIVAYTVIVPSFILVWPGLFLLLSSNPIASYTIFCLVGYVVMFGMLALPNHSAFCVGEMDSFGIRNKHCNFAWEDIQDVELCPVDIAIFRTRLLPTVNLSSVICIGGTQGGPFYGKNSKTCVFIPINDKNLERLRFFSSGKSAELDHLLETL